VSNGKSRRPRVLVVEDDSDIASLLSEILENEGYAAVAVTDNDDLKGQLDPRPDLIVLDLRLTRGSADQILQTVRARGLGDVPVVLLSAAGDLAERADELGVNAYVAKPFELEELLVVVRRFA
jgi:two-component system phosphate regulon response regulator PhoB